jgi:polysaccharide pyruvyl transferase WcaK-like protein
VKAFIVSDICILGGGGLFVDVFRVAPLLWFFHGYLAILLGKPLIMLGHSFDVRRGFSRYLLRYLLIRARVVTVRDEYSLNLARELGVSSEKLFLFSDLSFLADLSFSPEKKSFLAVSLCRWGISDSVEKVLVDFLNNILISGDVTYVRFFVFQSAHDDDLPVMQKIAALLPIHSYEFVYVHDELFEYKFSECRAALVMRLHALLLSFRSKTPFIALAYQSKVRHSMLDLGLADFCLSVDEVTSSNLMRLFRESLSYLFVSDFLDPVSELNALVDVVSSSVE